jgi:hypothetical protein
MTFPTGKIHHAFTRVYARSQGVEDRQIRAFIRRGEWVPLRRGVYAASHHCAAARSDPIQWHALQCAAVLLALTPRYVVAASSAARLYGLPFLDEPTTDVVLLTEAPVVHGIHRDGYLLRQAECDLSQVSTRYGIPLTSPARTLLDLACELPFMDGVIPTDAALHRELVTQAELDAILLTAEGRPNLERAREVFAFADGRSESPLESASRVVFHQHGVKPPDLQVTLKLTNGREPRVDFLWDDPLAGEADGLDKYEPTPDRSTLQVVRLEKAREEDIRDDGIEMIRWGWPEVRKPHLLIDKVRRGQVRAAERRAGRAS